MGWSHRIWEFNTHHHKTETPVEDNAGICIPGNVAGNIKLAIYVMEWIWLPYISEGRSDQFSLIPYN